MTERHKKLRANRLITSIYTSELKQKLNGNVQIFFPAHNVEKSSHSVVK